MNPRWGEIRNVVNPEISFGLCGSMNDDGSFPYLAGQEVKVESEVPKGMEVMEVPEQTYAVFRCTIPTIGETYEYAFKTWLPASGYEQAPSPDFEYYDEEFHPETSQTDPLYIYIPLRKKSGS
jgi:AraC family transcriptional regulator